MNEMNQEPNAEIVVDLRERRVPESRMSPEARAYALQAAFFFGSHERAETTLANKVAELAQAQADPASSPELLHRLEDEVAFYHTAALLVPEKSSYTED